MKWVREELSLAVTANCPNVFLSPACRPLGRTRTFQTAASTFCASLLQAPNRPSALAAPACVDHESMGCVHVSIDEIDQVACCRLERTLIRCSDHHHGTISVLE